AAATLSSGPLLFPARGRTLRASVRIPDGLRGPAGTYRRSPDPACEAGAPPSPLPRRSRRRPCPDRHRTSGDAATDALQGAAGTVRGDGTGTARADLLAGTPASPPRSARAGPPRIRALHRRSAGGRVGGPAATAPPPPTS